MNAKLVTALLALALLAGCTSSQPTQPAQKTEEKKTEAPKPPETATGREVFQRLYVAARGWAPDAKPFKLESATTSDANGHDGKAAVWRASFAAASRRALKTWIWSGTGLSGERGVTAGTEDTYSPSNTSTQVFEIAFLKTDSDKAFTEAQKHGGDKLLKKTPDQPVMYLLDWNAAGNDLIWHVTYGENRLNSKLAVAVNASTGAFIKVEH